MNTARTRSTLKALLGLSALAIAAQAAAQVTLYEGEGFRGRTFTTNSAVRDLNRNGFNDRASSVIVGSGRWEACEDSRFQGRCVVLRRGSYESLRGLGLENRISSLHAVSDRGHYDNEAPEPLAAPTYDYRRRPSERIFDAPITSVRAVVGPPNERCWVERQQVAEPERGGPNIGGAIAGAVLGGVLGHQVGGGRGKDIATAGGAVAGAAVGANVGRNSIATSDRDVRRCETTASTTPAYWDVTYDFRGVEHHVQMSAAPGRTIPVNRAGEPRL
jgi:uncharacterized protein YcfJ